MSIASEITRLQTSKADSKAQINIDKDIINDGIDFINNEKVDSYDEKIAEMQEAYKQYIPINSTSDTQIEAPKGGAIIGKTIKGNTLQDGTPTPTSPIEVKTVTGEQTITISNGADSKDYKINLKSKNWLHIDNHTQTSNGLTLEAKNGLIRITGTAGSGTYASFSLKNYINFNELNTIPNGTNLTFSVLNVAGTAASQIFIGITGNNYFLQPNSSTKYATATKSADLTSCSIYFTTTQNQIYDVFFDPMLEVGSTPSQFEPYYNYELNKIGNYQDYIRKGTGKNLINVPNGTVTTNGVTGSWNNNFVQISGTNTKTDANWILLSSSNFVFPDFKIGETYTISAFGKSNKTYVQINYDVRDTTTQKALVTMNGESKSFTVPEDFGSIHFIFIGIVRTTGTINENWYLQLEKDSATSYEPFGYKDKWYIEKNVGKVVFNGSEDWRYSSSLGAMYLSNYMKKINNTDIGAYSNKYMATTRNNYNANNYTIYGNNAGVLSIRDTDYTDANTFKTYLSTANVYAYYVLANPTYTLIENEELLEQLNRIMQLYEGQNNILVTGDLVATLDLNYIVKAENHL